MTRAEWTPKSLSAGKASYGRMKNASQTKTDAIRFIYNPPVHALVLNGLQDRVNIRKQRLELEVLLNGAYHPPSPVRQWSVQKPLTALQSEE
jgi:hypothetical protein